MKRFFGKPLILILLIAMVLLRVIEPGIDPPSFYSGHGQAELTDPYNLTTFARNAVIYNNSDPFNYHRWDIFKFSLVSAFSYLIFSVAGVSRAIANIGAVILNVGGLALFLLGLNLYWDRRKTAITALLLLINSTLFFYGRLPFLENGLIFLSGLTFFIFARYHERLWGQFLIGALIALAALAGKLFGIILLGPVLLTMIYMHHRSALKPIAVTIGGTIAGAVHFLLIAFGKNLPLLTAYYGEQTTGMYGAPPGFSSISNFFKMLLTYGGESGLWEYTPFLLLLAALSLILISLAVSFKGKLDKETIPLIFMLGWVAAGIFGLMPFKYRPMRYGLFLYLPLSALGAYAIAMAAEKKIKLSLNNKFITLPAIGLILWFLFTQVRIFFAPFGKKFESGAAALPAGFIIALLITGAIFLWLKNRPRAVSGRALIIVFALVGTAFMVHQAIFIGRGMLSPRRDLTEFSRELGPMLNRNAVITGPYGATLTIDDSLNNLIYMFGLADTEKDLFGKYKISHVAADYSNWKQALIDFPFLKNSYRILQVPIHDIIVEIYRVPESPVAPTDFERGAMYLAQGKADSAYDSFKRFNTAYPGHFFGRTHLAYAAMVHGSIDESLDIVNRLLAERPDDAILHGFCQTYFQQLYNITKDNKYLLLSQEHAARAKELR